MYLSDDIAIERIAKGVIDRTLPKDEWTHAAHFAAAVHILRHLDHLASPDEFRKLITAYNEATGTPNTETEGYHHTITVASLRAAEHHLDRLGPDTPLHRVLAQIMASDLGGRDWILGYWSREVLFSPEARRRWLDPDLAPLPF